METLTNQDNLKISNQNGDTLKSEYHGLAHGSEDQIESKNDVESVNLNLHLRTHLN